MPLRTVQAHKHDGWAALYPVLAVVAIAVNQRPALVAVGPLTPALRDDTGLGATATSLLTTLPLLCFGAFAMVAPVAGRRWGADRTLAGALVVLLCGIGLRMLPGVPALFIGSVVAGIGIAVTNVLLPSVIKRDFPNRTGPMMGLYSLCLNGGAALAAATSVPLGLVLGVGWRVALGAWGVLALIALAFWLPRARRARAQPRIVNTAPLAVWRSRLAWAVALYLALQSFVYYALIAWLPTLLTDAGLSPSRAGLTASVMSIAGMVTSLAVPILAVRRTSQRPLVWVSFGGFLFGMAGLLVDPLSAPWLWVTLLGIGQGAGIGLALTLFVLRTRTPTAAADLSGMAQTTGYLVAACGPVLAGALHDATAGWTAVLLALMVALVALSAAGWFAAGDRHIEDELLRHR